MYSFQKNLLKTCIFSQNEDKKCGPSSEEAVRINTFVYLSEQGLTLPEKNSYHGPCAPKSTA